MVIFCSLGIGEICQVSWSAGIGHSAGPTIKTAPSQGLAAKVGGVSRRREYATFINGYDDGPFLRTLYVRPLPSSFKFSMASGPVSVHIVDRAFFPT
jgi:hypothetical protein